MAKSKKNLVDEGFGHSLLEKAYFDGELEIPHIDGLEEMIIRASMVAFSQ
jgi:hypothetical protein